MCGLVWCVQQLRCVEVAVVVAHRLELMGEALLVVMVVQVLSGMYE